MYWGLEPTSISSMRVPFTFITSTFPPTTSLAYIVSLKIAISTIETPVDISFMCSLLVVFSIKMVPESLSDVSI
jgi:hypothetical protein